MKAPRPPEPLKSCKPHEPRKEGKPQAKAANETKRKKRNNYSQDNSIPAKTYNLNWVTQLSKPVTDQPLVSR